MSAMFFVIADPDQPAAVEYLTRLMESPHRLTSLGDESEFLTDLNERTATAGIATGVLDQDTGIVGVDLVDSIRPLVHGGQVRWLLVNGATSELLDVLVAMETSAGQVWRYIDAGTEEEFRP